MKKIVSKFLFLLALGFTLLLSCSKSDNNTDVPVTSGITVYKNQSTDVNADALQAQFKDPKFTVNIYGDFDTDKNPKKVKTLTYQKANSDTIVNLIVNQVSSRIDAIYYAVNGVKSPVVIKFDYTDNVTDRFNVSYYNYDWQNNTSTLFYATTVDKTNPSQYGNPFQANRHISGGGFKTDLTSVIASVLLIDGVSLGLGGPSLFCTTVGAPVLAAAIASGILAPIAIGVIVGLVASTVNASELIPSDLTYPPNTQTTNPITTTNNPIPHLQTSTCVNTQISFTATMDATGAIIFTTINGGQAPYTYMIESGFQQSTVFAHNYTNGSYLLAVKDANGCVNMKVIPLSRAAASPCDDTTAPYPTVTIGTQIWMQKNLNVCKYRNGDDIPQVQDPTAWEALTTGAWCYYNNDTANGPVYGKLYNWYAVNDPRGLAPTGNHIPSDAEWTILTTFLGGEFAGDKMKATTGWTPYSGITNTNSSGFTGLPGGYRSNNGAFDSVGNFGTWWSSSEVVTTDAWARDLRYDFGGANRNGFSKAIGFSVRCLRD